MSITDSIHGMNYEHEIKCYRCFGRAEYIEWDEKVEIESGEVVKIGVEMVCGGVFRGDAEKI